MSILNVNQIQPVGSGQTVTISAANITATGNISGNLIGNVNSTGVTTVTSLRIGTGTSISSPATNVLALGTNNIERIRVGTGGSVNIGATDTSYKLQVTGAPQNTNNFGILHIRDSQTLTGTAGTGGIFLSSSPGTDYYIAKGYNGSNTKLKFGNGNNGNEYMGIDDSGRVTIPYQPSFFVYGNTDVAISSADTFVKTTLWGGVSHNTGSHWSSNRFTAPVAGKYLFGVNLRLDNVNSGYSRVIIGKNGSTNLNINGHSIARYEVYGAGYYTNNVTILFNMAVDDYVEVYAYASSDASFISQSESQWWGYLVG